MHALLAHAYHLAQRLLSSAAWWPAAACIAIAAACRLTGLARTPRGTALAAAAAVLAGWLMLAPDVLTWHPTPIARLPALALLLLVQAAWRRPPAWSTILVAVIAAWWLTGGASDPVALLATLAGLAAALTLSRHLARQAPGWRSILAALILAAGLYATGASPHWWHAATLPALAGLTLLGTPALAPALAQALAGPVVVTAAAALLASDRGRLIQVDAACLLPLLAWASSSF